MTATTFPKADLSFENVQRLAKLLPDDFRSRAMALEVKAHRAVAMALEVSAEHNALWAELERCCRGDGRLVKTTISNDPERRVDPTSDLDRFNNGADLLNAVGKRAGLAEVDAVLRRLHSAVD